jgi:hypothetical protein
MHLQAVLLLCGVSPGCAANSCCSYTPDIGHLLLPTAVAEYAAAAANCQRLPPPPHQDGPQVLVCVLPIIAVLVVLILKHT